MGTGPRTERTANAGMASATFLTAAAVAEGTDGTDEITRPR